MKRSDFPFKPGADDATSSQGVFPGKFGNDHHASELTDTCERWPSPVFHVRGVGTREVEPRNTPTTVNAALNYRNFWDGRANNSFNGTDPFGLRNSSATVVKSDGTTERVDLRNSSLASQGVGPATSNVEMICEGRSFAQFGKKMIPRFALSLQEVSPSDGVLGRLKNRDNPVNGGKGLSVTYEELIKQAFDTDYTSAVGEVGSTDFTQLEKNFSLFWGLSPQLYQSTLISDRAPYDAWAAGRSSALRGEEKLGLDVFMTKGKCINCHKGPECTSAASTLQAENNENGLVERMLMADGGAALYDQGFYNVGITRTADDVGLGGKDPWGNPLSFTRQYTSGQKVDRFDVDPCTFEVSFDPSGCSAASSNLAGERTAVDGAFKTPTLRNVELTGPYFHNGSAANLPQVVEFYNRGGDFNNPEKDADITPLGLTNTEVDALVAFMKSLTDPRVKFERAPFDHPQLFIPNGHVGNEGAVQGGAFSDSRLARTEWLELPAVGRSGQRRPIDTFDQTLGRGAPNLRVAQRFDYGSTTLAFNPLPDRVSSVGEAATGVFTAYNTAGTDSGRIFYSASGLPTGIKLGNTGRLRGSARHRGRYQVTVIVYDELGAAAQATFKWTVR